MPKKSKSKMKSFEIALVFLFAFVIAVLSEVDNCAQTTVERKRCPANGDEELCLDLGCFYCPNRHPLCTEGIACRRTGLTDADNCWPSDNTAEPDKVTCRRTYGCSWCKTRTDYKCVKDGPLVNNCVQIQEQRKRCPANGNEAKCLEFGCHYCPNIHPLCTEGIACRRTGLTSADNCWPADNTDEPDSKTCRETYLCSWCKSRTDFKCVKDGPLGDADNCPAKSEDRKWCLAFGNREKCSALGCYYCPEIHPRCTEGKVCNEPAITEERYRCWPQDLDVEPNPENPKECREKYGCSWCSDDGLEFHCIKNKPTEVDNCAQTTDERKRCPANGDKDACDRLGCYLCPNRSPLCTEGVACRRAGLTEFDNCWPAGVPNPNAYDCRVIYKCSWCKNRHPDFQCVKDGPLSTGDCLAPEENRNLCYPFGDSEITEAQCIQDPSCTYCPDAEDPLYKCIRLHCPSGFEKRYESKSCCDPNGIGADQRIIGGTAAEEDQWPWMASIQEDGDHMCGGSLITAIHVLTAAHCDTDLSKTTVVLGTLNIITTSDGKVVRTVAERIVHPSYGTPKVDDKDIMILKLNTEVPSSIPPLSLPHGEVVPVNQRCFVMGWGVTSTDTNADTSPILMEVGIDIIDFKVCEELYEGDTKITLDSDTKICAGVLVGGKDSCQGDSGSPLVCQRCRNCDWYVAGLVSTGLECAEPDSPAIYTRVLWAEEWIRNNVDGRIAEETRDCNLY